MLAVDSLQTGFKTFLFGMELASLYNEQLVRYFTAFHDHSPVCHAILINHFYQPACMTACVHL